jgi:hypothetical protein
LNALSANYNLPLEHGNLNANVNRSLADKKNTVNLNYVMPFKDGGAVQSLETNLPALPKTDYHSIDKLMAHISEEFNIHPKKLHDDFVAKYHMTPDDWIKSGHYKKYGLGGIVKALTPMEEAFAKMRALKQAMKPEIELGKRYEEATKDMYTKDMPSFEEWKKTLPPPEVK